MVITLSVASSLETSLVEFLGKWKGDHKCSTCESNQVEATRKIKSLPRALIIFIKDQPAAEGSIPETLDLFMHMASIEPSKMTLAGFVCSTRKDSYFCVMRKGGKWLKLVPGKAIVTINDVREYRPILVLFTK